METTRITQIKAEIREVRREMKECGIRRVSCFNGGLSPAEYRANARLFQLSCDLDKAQRTTLASQDLMD